MLETPGGLLRWLTAAQAALLPTQPISTQINLGLSLWLDEKRGSRHDQIEALLREAGLLLSASGSTRSTYCFRHTYATIRLTEGVDVYFLSKQMGTSVKMIEDHYGHINPVKNAARILQGLPGWEPVS
ncbi:hypothetical protein [Brevundimonas diminuta]|uniref:hypothetical protein n=1 Tax=Brevundimonas diminuta TaxID=293 RepID=UPI001ABF5004|nr:hypothetical protein [Brevundimonas diminuta]